MIITTFVLQRDDPDIGDTGQFAEGALDFGRRNFFAADVGDFADTAKQTKFTVAVPFPEIRQRGIASTTGHRNTAIRADANSHIVHRFTNAATGKGGIAGAVAADAAG